MGKPKKVEKIFILAVWRRGEGLHKMKFNILEIFCCCSQLVSARADKFGVGLSILDLNNIKNHFVCSRAMRKIHVLHMVASNI